MVASVYIASRRFTIILYPDKTPDAVLRHLSANLPEKADAETDPVCIVDEDLPEQDVDVEAIIARALDEIGAVVGYSSGYLSAADESPTEFRHGTGV